MSDCEGEQVSSQDLLRPLPDDPIHNIEKPADPLESVSNASFSPPTTNTWPSRRLSPFWHDRLVEAGLILSMALYYIVGNENLGAGRLFHLKPLLSLPFLLIFPPLRCYRLSFTLPLPPPPLPYYLAPHPI